MVMYEVSALYLGGASVSENRTTLYFCLGNMQNRGVLDVLKQSDINFLKWLLSDMLIIKG